MADHHQESATSFAGHGVGWVESEAFHAAFKAHGENVRALHRLLLYVIVPFRGRAGLMNPSTLTLAERTGFSNSSVKRALADLRLWRLLDWKAGGKKGSQLISNHYRLGEALIAELNRVASSLAHPDEPQTHRASLAHPDEPQRTAGSSSKGNGSMAHLDGPESRKNDDRASVAHSGACSMAHESASSLAHPGEPRSISLEAKPLKQTSRSSDENQKHWCPLHSRPLTFDGKNGPARRFSA